MNARVEAVRILLAKAGQDERAARQLAVDPQIGDEVVGFHIQQAIEKRLKPLLTFYAIPYRRTHDLLELMDLLIAHGHPLTELLQALQNSRLSPWITDMKAWMNTRTHPWIGTGLWNCSVNWRYGFGNACSLANEPSLKH